MENSTEKVMLNLVLPTEQQAVLYLKARSTKESRECVKNILDDVKEKLLQTDVRKVENEDFRIEVHEASVVNQLDVNRLKQEHPDIYKEYLTQHRRNATARLRLK